MIQSFFNRAIFLTLTVAFTSCGGQIKREAPNEKPIITVNPKLIKNHFISGLDEETMFVQCGLQDKAGNMWFGTAGNGIYVYDGKSFTNFTHLSFIDFSMKEDLNHNDILCCMEDQSGNIWFGTRRGLIRYKPTTGKAEAKDFALILISQNTIINPSRTRLPYTFHSGDNFVWSIMQDKTGKIWFGTHTGIYIHNPITDNDAIGPVFTRLLDSDSLLNPAQLKLIDVSTMLQDRNGIIWFTSPWLEGEGIVRYDGTSITHFTPGGIKSFRSIIEKKNGDLLFLSPFHGVYLYDGNTFSNLNDKIGIKSDTLVSMLEDKNGNLWLGQSSDNLKNGGDGGLWCYNENSLQLFTTKEGLSHNHVFCIIPDREGNIWFGTRNTGLCQYDGKSFTDYTE